MGHAFILLYPCNDGKIHSEDPLMMVMTEEGKEEWYSLKIGYGNPLDAAYAFHGHKGKIVAEICKEFIKKCPEHKNYFEGFQRVAEEYHDYYFYSDCIPDIDTDEYHPYMDSEGIEHYKISEHDLTLKTVGCWSPNC